MNEEIKKKISKNSPKFWLGKKHTEETKKKMSESHKGKIPWNKGKKSSDKHKRNMVIGRKKNGWFRNPEEHRKRISEAMKGKLTGRHWKIKDTSMMGKGMKGRFGDRHPRWKGGISKVNVYFKRGEEYKLWRKACLERDNFTCQCSGKYGGKLIVHHINNFAEFSELRTTISNGITLCEKCHKEFHKKYGRENNTKEQLDEFFKSFK
jgi:hypothetical protein